MSPWTPSRKIDRTTNCLGVIVWANVCRCSARTFCVPDRTRVDAWSCYRYRVRTSERHAAASSCPATDSPATHRARRTQTNGTIQSFGVVVFSLPFLRTSNSPVFLWEFPEFSLRIQISFELIERLRDEVLHAALPVAEIGGVLIGKRASPNSDIEIMDAVALPADSDEPTGNFVIRTDALRKIIDQYSFGERRVIGFYRSHSGKRICLRSEDLVLIDQWFKDPSDVFLVIRPHDGRASAGFFYWQNGSVFGDFALTFPLSEAELKSRSWRSLIGGSKHAEWLRPFQDRVREVVLRARSSRNWLLTCGLAALLLVIAIGRTRAGFESGLKKSASSQDSSHTLGLRVQRNGLGVLVTWDRSASQIANATESNLLIWDGSSQPAYRPLTLTELRSGSAYCTIINDTVRVRMDVMDALGNAKTDSASLLSKLEPSAVENASHSSAADVSSPMASVAATVQVPSIGLEPSNASSALSQGFENTHTAAEPSVDGNGISRPPTAGARLKSQRHRTSSPKRKIARVPRLP